ncbi:hypothetical protein HETIRDRAFT_432558 [Heterobasidion irregulare TC 32-1]|uniref:Uncharacterized protein n=1 Tax=Heterobasidion irregulare (strain TC 32-1) TaxID=747525 RepID=W4KJK8_HETIT|nr:uncharacterized protein HETIRDRAFT_432558 [Heterobasidion irregulare TC 32-1]ETW86037.1 hypothetical protein HETIRDRAFT_432558 [Heterobasidion irregulare TC 32-1]
MRCGAMRWWVDTVRCGAAWPCTCACAVYRPGARAVGERDAGEERWDRRDAGVRTSGAAPDARAVVFALCLPFVEGVGSGLVRVRPTGAHRGGSTDSVVALGRERKEGSRELDPMTHVS